MASSPTGGVKPMPIAGPVQSERYRLEGMTTEERAWRKQWLQDQDLMPDEPRPIPGYYQERYNPIRRFYRWPLDKIFSVFIPRLGFETACHVRWWAGKALLVGFSTCVVYYYFKYNTRDWTRKGGWTIQYREGAILPGDSRYPYVSNKQPMEYSTEGFEKSPI